MNRVRKNLLSIAPLFVLVILSWLLSQYSVQAKDSSSKVQSSRSECSCGDSVVLPTGPEIFVQYKNSIHVLRGRVLQTNQDEEFNPNGDYTRVEAKRVWKSFDFRIEQKDEASILQSTERSCLRDLKAGEEYVFFFEKDFHIDTIQDFPICKNTLIALRNYKNMAALITGLDLSEVSLEIAEKYFARWQDWEQKKSRAEINAAAHSLCVEFENEELRKKCDLFFSGANPKLYLPKERQVNPNYNHQHHHHGHQGHHHIEEIHSWPDFSPAT